VGLPIQSFRSQGNTIDFLFSEKRNKKSAMRFFKKSIKTSGNPLSINLDKNPANNSALKSLNKTLKNKITVRNKRYLNNIIEQDHRFIKKLTRPTKGFKSFYSASATLKDIELCHMINKGQLKYYSAKTTFEQFYALAA
jgi:putative transposase